MEPKPLKVNGKVFDYLSFMIHLEYLVSQNKTTGNLSNDARINFTKINFQRMKRIFHTVELEDHVISNILNISEIQQWYVITEAWCGDSAQILPIIGKMSLFNTDKISLHIILRDENPEWMNYYHTNGSKSIPKFIIRNSNNQDIAIWGPRPRPAAGIHQEWKANNETYSHSEFEYKLHAWYAKDKTKTTQMELNAIISTLNSGLDTPVETLILN